MTQIKPGTVIFSSKSFRIVQEQGYLSEKVEGKFNIQEATEATAAIILHAEQTGCRQLLLDVDKLKWINDISIRKEGIELAGKARHLLSKVAIVTKNKAIRFLVLGLLTGGGIKNVRCFTQNTDAHDWLAGTDNSHVRSMAE